MTTPAVMARATQRRNPATSQVVASADSSSARSVRSRGEYRSFFTFEHAPDNLALVLEQASAWLRDKNFDQSLETTGVHRSQDRTLTVVHRASSHCLDVRLLLTEENTKRGRWHTNLTLHLPGRSPGWLSLHVANDEGTTAAPPRLARWLLDVIDASDGSLRLTPTARTVGVADVEDLLEAVCDPERRGLLFVTGTAATDPLHGRSFTAFRDRAGIWARQVVGLGQVVVLDPLATDAFNAGIGDTHAITPWTIRTYAPDPDPAWDADARRHRIFSPARLHSTSDHAVAQILGFSARAHAAERRLPAFVESTDRDLKRARNQLLLDDIFTFPTTEAPTDPSPFETAPVAPAATPVSSGGRAVDHGAASAGTDLTPESPRLDDASALSGAEDAALNARVVELTGLLDLVAVTLDIEAVSPHTLAQYRLEVEDRDKRAAVQAAHAMEMADLAREQFKDLQAQFEQLEDDLAFHREYAEAADELRDEADLRASRAVDEIQYFRKQLDAAGQHRLAYDVVPLEAYSHHPDSFEDLMERMSDELSDRGVVFTGDATVTRRLDSNDTSGRLVRSAWDCLLALAGYVEAVQSGHAIAGVHGYLTRAPAGYPVVSRNKFAAKESTSTMNRFGEERRLPVPLTVDDDGSVLMEAHFRLGPLGIVSPRLHFHDDIAGTGRIYVGHIGPHLRTEGTN